MRERKMRDWKMWHQLERADAKYYQYIAAIFIKCVKRTQKKQ